MADSTSGSDIPSAPELERRIRVLEELGHDERERQTAAAEAQTIAAELERRAVDRTAELERERAQLALLVENIPVGVVLRDARTGEVLFANRRIHEMLRHPPPASHDLDVVAARAYHPDGTAFDVADLPTVRALREECEVRGVPIEYHRPDGSRIFIEATALPIRTAGGIRNSVLTIYDDVTARERRERAEREFVINAAHELQSPIAAVLAAAEALEAGAKHDAGERDRFIRHITAACHRLARLTNALLVLARADTGTEDPKVELVELAPLLRAVAGATTVHDGVELRIVVPPDAAVLAHRGLLEQAVVNLLANAAKHTRSGTITVETRTGRGTVEIAVDDTGTGIAPEDRERVKRRFVRLDTDSDGFGLGLAITDRAVRAMSGELRIESRQGGGTTATIVLPAATVISP